MEKREACQQVPKDVPQPLQKMLRRSSDPDPINYHNHEEIGLCNSKSIPTISKMVAMHRANRNVLGLPDCPTQELEQCSLLVYDSMEAPTRVFHNLDHIFDLVTQMNNRSVGPDPIAISAIAFHDVIYYQVDGGLSDRQRQYLHDVIIEHDDGSISISQKPLGRSVELVMDIFGYSYGQVLNPFKGMNEFLSACIGCRVYESLDKGRCSKLTDSLNAKRAACIEATVPFRGPDEQGRNPPEALFDRLKVVNVKYNLGWDEEETILAVQRSVDLSNRDIDNFSWTDRAAFLSNTWKLLPESNVTLREKVTFSISEMALAMKKQAGFFEFLDPDTIFFSFRNPELEKVVKEKTEQARQNIDTALTYMRCKYLALSVLSAIAELTGGDTPICLFCGDRQISESRMHSSTIEDYLDYKRNPEEGIKVHEEVLRILREGRKLETDFDKRNSPLGAYLYSRLGNDGLTDCIKYAVHPMAKESGMELLRSLPKVVAMDILGAVSKLALTRTSEIRKVMNQINL